MTLSLVNEHDDDPRSCTLLKVVAPSSMDVGNLCLIPKFAVSWFRKLGKRLTSMTFEDVHFKRSSILLEPSVSRDRMRTTSKVTRLIL